MTIRTPSAIELIKKINEVKSHLTKLECELSGLPGSSLICEVINQNTFSLDSDADLLVASIRDRDWPMTYDDIKAVFDASGFLYERRHIEACHPDSHDAVREEMLRYQE